MRIVALFNLCYLFFLVSSIFSSVHVDHAMSHEAQCGPTYPTASCHSDMPHEHQETHPGEDSLLEHTFEDGASLIKSFMLIIGIFPSVTEPLTAPEFKILHGLTEPRLLVRNFILQRYQSSRAPPAISL